MHFIILCLGQTFYGLDFDALENRIYANLIQKQKKTKKTNFYYIVREI